jgi:hypothetical protein
MCGSNTISVARPLPGLALRAIERRMGLRDALTIPAVSANPLAHRLRTCVMTIPRERAKSGPGARHSPAARHGGIRSWSITATSTGRAGRGQPKSSLLRAASRGDGCGQTNREDTQLSDLLAQQMVDLPGCSRVERARLTLLPTYVVGERGDVLQEHQAGEVAK